MQKIPTLFVRDPNDRRHLLPEVTSGCEWVLAGEGTATRKYDGTCVMLVEPESLMSVVSLWWARREVKPDKAFPPNFSAVMRDENTGKTVGWEPIEQSPFSKFHAEAISEGLRLDPPQQFTPGTYELCGPKINHNPEGYDTHELIPHKMAERVSIGPRPGYQGPWSFEMLKEALMDLSSLGWEGIVWHHPDGRMAKLKVRDFT